MNRLVFIALLAVPAFAQIPAPQIPLTGNIGCSGFPCQNNGTLIVPSDANYTMTATDTSAAFIKVTSSVVLTATRNIIAPAGNFAFSIENATQGGQAIQIIGPTGAGVTIPNGATAHVWFDGTNYQGIGGVLTGPFTAPFISSFTCVDGNSSVDQMAAQAAINYVEANAPNGRGVVLAPQNERCNFLPPSSTSTEVLLVTGPVSLQGNNSQWDFQMPAPATATATQCSINASTGMATITASNSFVAGWTGYLSGFSGGCSSLNVRFTVSATGLSGSQFEFHVPFYVASNLSPTSDSGTATANMSAIHFAVPSTVSMYNVKWQDMQAQFVSAPDTQSSTVGGDMYNFDTSQNGQYPRMMFYNLSANTGPAGFNSFFMDNFTNANGGLDYTTFANVTAYSGGYFQHLGDNNHFNSSNWFNPNGDAFNAENISGATGNTIDGGVVEGSKTNIHLRGGLGWNISTESAGENLSSSSTAGIYLDGSDYVYNQLNGTVISHTEGVDMPAAAVPIVLIDPQVTNTSFGNGNNWVPPVVSNVPQPAIVNNGTLTRIDGMQTYPPYYDYNLYGGNGTWGQNTPLTANGAGRYIENDGTWSDDPRFTNTNTSWNNAGTDSSGSSVTVSSTPTTLTGPHGNQVQAYAVTMTLGANGVTGYTAVLNYVSRTALPNPHGIVEKVYMLPASCPATLTFVYISMLQTVNCGGTFNGWTQLLASQGNVSGTSATLTLKLVSTTSSTYSTTMTFYLYRAMLSQNNSDDVKTTNQPVPGSYGNDPTRFAPNSPYPVTTSNGFLDVPASTLPNCGTGTNAVAVGTVKQITSTASPYWTTRWLCDNYNTTLGTYTWKQLYAIPPQGENEFLQSNTWNNSPVQLKQSGTALAPVVTTTSTITDPWGNINSPYVQQVVFNLNGDSTPGDYSLVEQDFSGLSNPHTMIQGIYLSSTSGTPTILFGNVYGTPETTLYTIPTYPAWTYISLPYTVAATTDAWKLLLEVGYTSSSATLYVAGAYVTRNNGQPVSIAGVPVVTTSTAINNTANTPVLCSTTGSAGQFCDPTETWITPLGTYITQTVNPNPSTTGMGIGVNSGSPYLLFVNSSAGSNQKVTGIYGSTSGLTGLLYNDALSSTSHWFDLTRSGQTPTLLTFDEPVVSGQTTYTESGCTTSATSGTGTTGTMTVTQNSCTAVVTLNGATGMTATHGWTCDIHDRTQPTLYLGGESSSTTTTASFTIPSSVNSGDVLSFKCASF